MNPTNFIQPAFFHELFETQEGNVLEVKKEHEEILKELDLLLYVNKLTRSLEEKPFPAAAADQQQHQTQEEVIAANVMPTINYILHSLHSFIVSSKQLMNWSAEKVLGNETTYKFSFSKAEKLEVMRKELTKNSITIVQVANLFEVPSNECQDLNEKSATLQLKDGVTIPECFNGIFDKIKDLLQAELTKNGDNLAEKLKELQEGKQPYWYDFKSLEHTNYPKAVQIFKDCMAYITDLLIAASAILKGVANYIYHFHKDQELLNLNSAEVVSDLNRDRGNTPLDWAKLKNSIKNAEGSPEIL